MIDITEKNNVDFPYRLLYIPSFEMCNYKQQLVARCLQFYDKIPINKMSPLNTDDLHRIFKNLDQNGDGFVSLAELELLLERIGMQSTQGDLESVVGKTNLDLLGFESLYDTIVKRKIGGESQDGPDEEERENDLVEAFKVYDQDGDGFISCEELERVLTQLGFPNENASQDCKTMIDTYDMNSDGVLDFEEFKKMMLVIES